MAGIPERITAGTTASFSLALTAFPAPDWSLRLIMRGPTAIDLPSTPDGALHLFEAAASKTGEWESGAYWYSLRATNGGEVHEVETGTVYVDPDLASLPAGYDGRTHARKTLEAIEAVIEGRASKDQDSYRINNRELRRTPVAQLLKLRGVYRREVAQESDARRGKTTLGRQILARFS